MKRRGISRGLNRHLIIEAEDEETISGREFIYLREYVLYTILANYVKHIVGVESLHY